MLPRVTLSPFLPQHIYPGLPPALYKHALPHFDNALPARSFPLISTPSSHRRYSAPIANPGDFKTERLSTPFHILRIHTMLSSRLFFLFSFLFVFLALASAAPVVPSSDLAKRVAEPQNGMGGSSKDWKREAQNGMGGSSKDWKREPEAEAEAEADPQGGFGGFNRDWKREAAPEPQGFGGVSKDWKREPEPQHGLGGRI